MLATTEIFSESDDLIKVKSGKYSCSSIWPCQFAPNTITTLDDRHPRLNHETSIIETIIDFDRKFQLVGLSVGQNCGRSCYIVFKLGRVEREIGGV